MSPPWHNPQTVGLVHTVRLGSAISFPIDLQHKQPRNILQREKQKWRNNGSLLSEKQIPAVFPIKVPIKTDKPHNPIMG